MGNSYLKAFVLWCVSLCVITVSAQETRPWMQYVNEVMTAEDVASQTWEDTYELLCELEQHPLDLNRASREQLEALPFLTATQVEELMEYQYRYGPMKSMGELQMIRSLDFGQRRLLSCFVYVGEETDEGYPSLKDIVRYGRNELITTARIPLREREDNDDYLGPPYRHWLRYQFTYGDALKAGLVGAQDAGEPFFARQNKWGYDYYSLYLQLRRLGRLESLCLGNYRVSMGMGLVMNSEFSLGKVAMLQTMGRSANTLRAHSSRSANSLQGAAATINMGCGLHLTAFASYRPIDATLNKDSTAATILTTGYHRTETEMRKKNDMHALKTGGSLCYQQHGIHLGLHTLYVWLDRPLHPNTTALYRQHYPHGTDFLNTSFDYGYTHHCFSLNGETALDKYGHLATINTLSLRLGDGLSVMALQRFYSYRYTSLDAQSYSDGGRVQNESGLYVGLSWQPSPSVRVAAYTDYAYFPWARYQMPQSSSSWDHLLQGTILHRNWTFGARYRLHARQHRFRLSADYAGTCGFGSRTQLDGGYGDDDAHEWGTMLSQSLSYTRGWLRLNGGVGYYHTDSYASRVWLYENGPLYTYSVNTFYGEGLRCWLMARVDIAHRLMLTLKIGNHPSHHDLDFQLRWKI